MTIRSCPPPLSTADSAHPLSQGRYLLLRSYRRDGRAVDTPVWFLLDGDTVLLRTKIGPKTRRLTANPVVALTVCDHRGRVRPDAPTTTGRARILRGAEAEHANRMLHRRYGWQWNVVPLLRLPGIVNVHRGLPWREKLRRLTATRLWPDSAIVAVTVPAASVSR
ncbi:PPOX class F420-dependent oxidoreductase [Mycobacterium koreense]|uniref:PPOX class F420-dependent enzyme n=1 Tax=Mycolicibacillus koreensis TaxID=1069220 RepID=A0A7I7SA00_9MYCO|nr:PPOX class F420-dependent oxidoreductase [Mycolicibacillus koreensis]MCV7248875.1 PPOX class F420-dependent oxidoreductase [Mycolicibacillus koreensis]OSC36018.1 PPOX class F420-dependent enzyme [Mycolicibacillus koreensis]BBY53722.1 PPOX class F420-dependent oxidoreductase [Mycolicibacillus koreensis]